VIGASAEAREMLAPVYEETNANRATFEAFCRSLTAEELARDVPRASWTVKDYIAHLATIDIWVGEWFEHLADGTPWRPRLDDGSPFNIDTWNEARIVERKGATVEQLLEEAAQHRVSLWAAVDRFTPEVLGQQFSFRENTITYLRYLQLWAGHDPAHSADMLRAMPGRLEDPAVKAWLAKYRLA
jgi:hypothetical protein